MKFEQKKNLNEGEARFEPAKPGLNDQCAHHYATATELQKKEKTGKKLKKFGKNLQITF